MGVCAERRSLSAQRAAKPQVFIPGLIPNLDKHERTTPATRAGCRCLFYRREVPLAKGQNLGVTRHPISLHPKMGLSRILLAYKMKPILLDKHPDKKTSEKVQTCRNVPGIRDMPMPCAVAPKLVCRPSYFFTRATQDPWHRRGTRPCAPTSGIGDARRFIAKNYMGRHTRTLPSAAFRAVITVRKATPQIPGG